MGWQRWFFGNIFKKAGIENETRLARPRVSGYPSLMSFTTQGIKRCNTLQQ
jgi:hypothetical protein